MNPLHLISVLLRLTALLWATGMALRYRDWRFSALAALVALLLVHPVRDMVRNGGATPMFGIEGLWGPVISFFLLGAVFVLDRLIADQQAAGEQMSHSLRVLQLVMDTIPQRVFWKDREYRYIGCNRAAAEDAGLSAPEEIVGKTDFDLAWRRSAHIYREDDEAVIAENEAKLNYEEPQVREDGTTAWLRTTKIPLRNEAGEVIGIFGSYEDITERKRAEEDRQKLEAQLRQMQKIESVGQLAGGIAHDFNNLLTTIQGHAELLMSDAGLPERYVNDLDEIRKASRQGAFLTQQLLAFSRRQVLLPRTLDLSAVVDRLRDRLLELIGPGQQLEIRRDPDLGLIHADPGQVEQIVVSLVVNAHEAMPHGGRIEIETGSAEFDQEFVETHPGARQGSYVSLCVRDDGPGMDEATIERAFEPFFTTKGPGRGSGLGLSMVYGIVKQSGGYIWLSSEPGRGTECTVYFPRVAGEAEPEPEPAEEPESPHGWETVLVVEDTEQVRRLAERVLREHGYSVLSTGDPEEALKIAASHEGRLHLLVADMVLPKMTGREMAERLREVRPDIGVLYMSGYTQEAIFQRGLLDPGVVFLQKPFSVEALLAKVRQALSRR